jgi:hypothetical protein
VAGTRRLVVGREASGDTWAGGTRQHRVKGRGCRICGGSMHFGGNTLLTGIRVDRSMRIPQFGFEIQGGAVQGIHTC